MFDTKKKKIRASLAQGLSQRQGLKWQWIWLGFLLDPSRPPTPKRHTLSLQTTIALPGWPLRASLLPVEAKTMRSCRKTSEAFDQTWYSQTRNHRTFLGPPKHATPPDTPRKLSRGCVWGEGCLGGSHSEGGVAKEPKRSK